MTEPLLQSPLHSLYLSNRAKFAEFGGWSMPLVYSEGTLQEHKTCRTECQRKKKHGAVRSTRHRHGRGRDIFSSTIARLQTKFFKRAGVENRIACTHETLNLLVSGHHSVTASKKLSGISLIQIILDQHATCRYQISSYCFLGHCHKARS